MCTSSNALIPPQHLMGSMSEVIVTKEKPTVKKMSGQLTSIRGDEEDLAEKAIETMETEYHEETIGSSLEQNNERLCDQIQSLNQKMFNLTKSKKYQVLQDSFK